ncbi:conserved hypothetical protein [Mesorhizobium escarrei]|uniref:Uncharacterized protein n=1 Tax=Mesorhizobium escarrei TaxID=666018 RepID=A0ABM9DN88_9HYPH|nr:conserved hypothetical protein [Mesorhizobium escarrei]
MPPLHAGRIVRRHGGSGLAQLVVCGVGLEQHEHFSRTVPMRFQGGDSTGAFCVAFVPHAKGMIAESTGLIVGQNATRYRQGQARSAAQNRRGCINDPIAQLLLLLRVLGLPGRITAISEFVKQALHSSPCCGDIFVGHGSRTDHTRSRHLACDRRCGSTPRH